MAMRGLMARVLVWPKLSCWLNAVHFLLCVSHAVVSDSLQLCGLIAHQALLSVEFSRQEYWSGLSFPSSGELSDPGIKPGSPALQADALPSQLLGSPSISLSYRDSLIKWGEHGLEIRQDKDQTLVLPPYSCAQLGNISEPQFPNLQNVDLHLKYMAQANFFKVLSNSSLRYCLWGWHVCFWFSSSFFSSTPCLFKNKHLVV